jgi:serine/threonine protein kinase
MLGKGGMGEVWHGEHELTGRPVAVKVLSDAYLGNKKVVARFGREARAASAVQHEGIVEILDQDRTDDGVPFLVMEFLDGESVGQRIKRNKRLGESETLAIMSPLLDALDAAHQAGVIHRDLKPDNVFILPGVRGDERIKILDFGISQKADEIEHRLTQEGSVLGTPHYMSPEQARGESNIDVRVDVYAAAVLMYECLVGEVPFDAGNYNALLQIIISRPPVPPRVKGVEMATALEQVLMAALAKRREERPPNARAFRELLLEASMQGPNARLETRSWSFQSVPDVSLAPSRRPKGPTPSLEADIFAPARTTGSLRIPPGQQLEPAWSPSVRAPASAAARRAASAIAQQSSAPAESPRITLTGAAPLELDMPARAPQPTSRAVSRVAQPVRPLRPTGTAKPKRSIVGAVVGWMAALGALVLLVYLASAVFKRPDPRKHKRASDDGAESAGPSVDGR